MRNLSQIAFPLLHSSMCRLPCSEFKNLYIYTTIEYLNVKQLSCTINYSSRCSRSSVDYVSSLALWHCSSWSRTSTLCDRIEQVQLPVLSTCRQNLHSVFGALPCVPFLLQALQAMFRRLHRRPNIYEGGLYTCILRNAEPKSSQKMHSRSIYLSFVKIKLYLSEYVFIFNISRYLRVVTSHANPRTCSVLQRVNQTFVQIVFFG